MTIILDECLPRGLRAGFPDHDVTTVPAEGHAGLSNGDLLEAIKERFDPFVTIDAGIGYQQRLEGLPMIVVMLRAPSNRIEDLLPLTPAVNSALESASAGDILSIE